MRTKRAKGRILDELCLAYECERKYMSKLLTGKRNYKAREGRKASYSEESKRLAMKVWIACGQPCSKYFKYRIEKSLRDYQEIQGEIEWGSRH